MPNAIYRRDSARQRAPFEPKLIGDIPPDAAAQLAAGKRYVVMAIEDPDNPGEFIGAWGLLSTEAVSPTLIGWGYNWGNNWGGNP